MPDPKKPDVELEQSAEQPPRRDKFRWDSGEGLIVVPPPEGDTTEQDYKDYDFQRKFAPGSATSALRI